MTCLQKSKRAKSLQSCLTLCNPMDSRLLCPWDSPGKSTTVGCRALLRRIFPTKGSNLRLLGLPALAGGFFTTSVTREARDSLATYLRRVCCRPRLLHQSLGLREAPLDLSLCRTWEVLFPGNGSSIQRLPLPRTDEALMILRLRPTRQFCQKAGTSGGGANPPEGLATWEFDLFSGSGHNYPVQWCGLCTTAPEVLLTL